MLFDQIAEAKTILLQLAFDFRRAVQSRSMAETIILSQKDAHQKLREISTERGQLLRAEISEMLVLSTLSQERVSLLLRFRSPEADPDGRISADIIDNDLKCVAYTTSFAADMFASLGTYEPLTPDEQTDIQGRIQVNLNETNRILKGISESPLSETEAQVFHSIYETPEDPFHAYCGKTELLAQSAIKLVVMTGDRIGQTLRYVDCIDRIVVPAFPDHAEGMKVQAVNMLSEAAESFTRMDALIKRAEMYLKQATQSVPVRGLQP